MVIAALFITLVKKKKKNQWKVNSGNVTRSNKLTPWWLNTCGAIYLYRNFTKQYYREHYIFLVALG